MAVGEWRRIHVYIGSLQALLSIQSVTGRGLSRKNEGCTTAQKEASLLLHNQNSCTVFPGHYLQVTVQQPEKTVETEDTLLLEEAIRRRGRMMETESKLEWTDRYSLDGWGSVVVSIQVCFFSSLVSGGIPVPRAPSHHTVTVCVVISYIKDLFQYTDYVRCYLQKTSQYQEWPPLAFT